MDPCEILMRLEERAVVAYELRTPPMCEDETDRISFVRNWVRNHINEL